MPRLCATRAHVSQFLVNTMVQNRPSECFFSPHIHYPPGSAVHESMREVPFSLSVDVWVASVVLSWLPLSSLSHFVSHTSFHQSIVPRVKYYLALLYWGLISLSLSLSSPCPCRLSLCSPIIHACIADITIYYFRQSFYLVTYSDLLFYYVCHL